MKHAKSMRGLADTGRPFTGAWIETGKAWKKKNNALVAPSRGRGLKQNTGLPRAAAGWSPLHGGVD